MRKRLEIIPMPRSTDILTTMLAQTMPWTKEIGEGTWRLHIYNGKMDGECKTQPSLRYTVLRQGYMQQVIQATTQARCSTYDKDDPESVELDTHSIYMFLDAFKHDNASTFVNCFSAGEKKMKKKKGQPFTYPTTSRA